MITTQKVAYYQNSEVRVTNERNPNYNAVGDVIGGEQTEMGFALKIKRLSPQGIIFIYDEADIKITKRK